MSVARALVLVFAPVAIACGGPAAGSACTQPSDCGERLRCVATPGGGSVCMAPCDADTWLCQDGAVCLESPSSGRVCWFGGGTPLGTSCAEGGDLECEPGTVCAPSALCAQACELERPVYLDPSIAFDPASVCERNERCEPLAGGVPGVCRAIPDAGAADAGITSP